MFLRGLQGMKKGCERRELDEQANMQVSRYIGSLEKR
jgi:hypothetical protein